jgi:hypothetical protein|tara:strand:- start:34 stop:219 length:186 start_codon:yes stop_codon:yes gene_type:complete
MSAALQAQNSNFRVLDLPILQVARLVLEEVVRFLKTRSAVPDKRPLPRFQTVNGRFVFDHE